MRGEEGARIYMGQELGRDMYNTQLGRIGVYRFKRPVRKQKYQVMGMLQNPDGGN